MPYIYQMLELRIWNNMEWYKSKNILEFLSQIGGHFRMGTMLRKEYIRSRLSSVENNEGLTFMEFTYQIFQAYDWLHLYQNENCVFQIGGSDQMGNMEAGYELIKKVTGQTAHCITTPLIKSGSGEKLSKSVGNVIWLDRAMTSPFNFYQYFVRLPDDKLEDYLRYYTFWDDDRIRDICRESKVSPEARVGQTLLARYMTTFIHGPASTQDCELCSDALYTRTKSFDLTPLIAGGDFTTLELLLRTCQTVDVALGSDGVSAAKLGGGRVGLLLGDVTMDLSDTSLGQFLLMCCQDLRNETEVRENIDQNAITINGKRVKRYEDAFDIKHHSYSLTPTQGSQLSSLSHGANDRVLKYITLVKIGKRKYTFVKWLSPPH